MFIGHLEEYKKFSQNLEKLIEGFDGRIEDSENMAIDYNETFNEDFFKDPNTFDEENSQLNLPNIPVEISGLGFDLFYKAKQSPYGFQGELEKIYVKGDEDADDEDHTNFNANISAEVYKDPKEREKFEEAHQAQKFEEIEEKPDQITVENSDNIIKAQEEQLLRNI